MIASQIGQRVSVVGRSFAHKRLALDFRGCSGIVLDAGFPDLVTVQLDEDSMSRVFTLRELQA